MKRLKSKVISRKNLPVRLPVKGSVLCILAMDYWEAPEWAWGIAILLLIIIWIGCFISLFREKPVNLFHKLKTLQRSEKNNK